MITNIFPQGVSKTTVELFPAGLNFIPLRGSNPEAKLGILYYTSNSNLKVDIGNSMELIKVSNPELQGDIRIGIEFMAYAKAISYSGYRLQIATVDGFFGGHISYLDSNLTEPSAARFRYIHNSAHLVDGKYDISLGQWVDGKLPVPFMRDFAELVYAKTFSFSGFKTRLYGGGSVIALIRPSYLKRLAVLTGAEVYFPGYSGTFLNQPMTPFIVYHFQIAGLPEYQGSSHIQAGLKFGEWDKKSLNFYLSYYSGNNPFSEYFNERIAKFGIGFTVDFPG